MLGFPRQGPAPHRRPSPLEVNALEDRVNPVILARPDVYSVVAGQVLTVPFQTGVLANDQSTTSFGAVLTARLTGTPTYFSPTIPAALLPAVPNAGTAPSPNPILNPNGSFTFIAPPANQLPLTVTAVTFTYQVTTATDIGFGTVTINLIRNQVHYLATGADAGGGPRVRVFEAGTGVPKYDFFAYEPTFTGGVRVAVGDLTNDGIDDIVTMPGAGGAGRLKVYDGKDLSLLYDAFVFETTFVGGGYVAIGDFTGDGQNDIVIGAGEGGGSRVQVLSPTNVIANPLFQPPLVVADFFAYDPSLSTGVRVAAGNLTVPLTAAGTGGGTGPVSIVTAPGAGGAPQIRTFDLQNIIGRNNAPAPATLSFFAGETSDRSGEFVAVGQFSGNGLGDIVTGTGAGSSVVQVFNGRTGGLIRQFAVPNTNVPVGSGTVGGPNNFLFQTGQSGTLLAPTTAPNALAPTVSGTGFTFSNQTGAVSGGIRVATSDWDGDGVDDIITATGPANSPVVRVFNTLNQLELAELFAFNSNFLGGVNVAAD